MAKPHQIKVLSNLQGMSPLLMDLKPEDDSEPISKVVLDLSFVTAIDSIATSLLLARLTEFFKNRRYDQFELIPPRNERINSYFHQTGASDLFAKLLKQSPKGLSTGVFDLFDSPTQPPPDLSVGRDSTHAILIEVDTYSGKSREELNVTVRSQLRELFAQIECSRFNQPQLLVVVAEMVKNTFDHSGARAFIGVHVELDSNLACSRVCLSYVDTGIGITQSVRTFLTKQLRQANPPPSDLVRKVKKGATSEFLRDAFLPDFTTKPNNGINFGIGLTLIQRGIKGAGFSCLLLETQSAVNITSFDVDARLSHEEIRRGSSRIVGSPPLTFILEWRDCHG